MLPNPGSPISIYQIYEEYYKNAPPLSGTTCNLYDMGNLYNISGGEGSEMNEFLNKEVITPYINDWSDPLNGKTYSGTDTNLGFGSLDCSVSMRSWNLPSNWTWDISIRAFLYVSNSTYHPTEVDGIASIYYRISTNGGSSWGDPILLDTVSKYGNGVNSKTVVTKITMGTNYVIQFMLKGFWDSLTSGNMYIKTWVRIDGGTPGSANQLVNRVKTPYYFECAWDSAGNTGYEGNWNITLI